MSEWSTENESGAWIGNTTGPSVGAKFRGSNRNGSKSWKTVATVTEADPGRSFVFAVTAGPFKVSTWAYKIEDSGRGCTVTESWSDQRNVLTKIVSKQVSGVEDRPDHNRKSMEVTLERLAAEAEKTP